MYPIHKKTGTKAGKTTPDDCFAEKMGIWFWILGIIAVGATIYAVVTSFSQGRADAPTGGQFPQSIQGRVVAYRTCPYGPGYLDAQGRCNVGGCPIYDPSWGKSSGWENVSQGPVLVKKLALEVGTITGKKGVAIHSVYLGGGADRAGLQAGDMIYRFNGRRVRDIVHFQSLVAKAKPESKAKIEVFRDKKKKKSVVMIGEGEMEGVSTPMPTNSTPRPLGGRLF